MENIEERIAHIREDREHGSRWLVRETILLLRDLAEHLQHSSRAATEQQQHLLEIARELAGMRPGMAALPGAVGRIVGPQPEATAVFRTAERLLADYDTATERITQAAQPYIHGRLLTCSISGTVVDVLHALSAQIEHVIVTEGRPRYEGRETAHLLSSYGIPVTLITDAQAAIFLPLCSAVLVGADSILAHGELLNKAGTALLAWSARGYQVPFYVLCETLKISPQTWPGVQPELLKATLPLLEEKEADEVLEPQIPGVQVRNFYFDSTPYSLLSGVITERGLLDLPTIETIAQQARVNAQHLAAHK